MYTKDLYIHKIENKEIDILELLKYILKKWKKICGISVVLFVLLSLVICYKFFQNNNGQVIDGKTQVVMEQLSENQQTRVESVLKSYKELDNMEDYKNNSAYMQLNAYDSRVTTIQYFVSASSEKNENIAYELYLNYVEQGNFKEELQKELGSEINQPEDLVILRNDYYSASEGNDLDKKVLTLKINAPDEKLNEQIKTIVKKSMDDYRLNVVNKFVGQHDLKIISESSFGGLDDSVREKQEGIERSIEEKRQQILEMENRLTVEEKAVLDQKRNFAESGKEEITENNGQEFPYKRLLVVLFLSIFMACGIYVLSYFGNNKLKYSKEISKYFDISCIEIKKGKKKEVIRKELELLCKTCNVESIFVSCLEGVGDKAELQEIFPLISGTTLILGENIYNNVDAMEKAKSCGNVIFVAKTYVTNYNSILETLQKCEDLGINVIGAIVDDL